MIVLCNTSNAISSKPDDLYMTEKEKILVKIAALLHDIDDHKYFPENSNFENARKLLSIDTVKQIDGLTDNEISSILLMIYLVSSSVHGDTMPTGLPDWYFYPRYADRLEALGIIGLKRTLEYTIKKGQPLFRSDTKRANTKEELFNEIATITTKIVKNKFFYYF
jgi:HD superfamily phosphodiesterase